MCRKNKWEQLRKKRLKQLQSSSFYSCELKDKSSSEIVGSCKIWIQTFLSFLYFSSFTFFLQSCLLFYLLLKWQSKPRQSSFPSSLPPLQPLSGWWGQSHTPPPTPLALTGHQEGGGGKKERGEKEDHWHWGPPPRSDWEIEASVYCVLTWWDTDDVIMIVMQNAPPLRDLEIRKYYGGQLFASLLPDGTGQC